MCSVNRIGYVGRAAKQPFLLEYTDKKETPTQQAEIVGVDPTTLYSRNSI